MQDFTCPHLKIPLPCSNSELNDCKTKNALLRETIIGFWLHGLDCEFKCGLVFRFSNAFSIVCGFKNDAACIFWSFLTFVYGFKNVAAAFNQKVTCTIFLISQKMGVKNFTCTKNNFNNVSPFHMNRKLLFWSQGFANFFIADHCVELKLFIVLRLLDAL